MLTISSKKTGVSALAFAAAVLFFHESVVQAQPADVTTKTTQHRLLVSDMMKSSVIGSANKNIGEIRDLVIDMTSGKVRYAILEFDPGFSNLKNCLRFPSRRSLSTRMGKAWHTVKFLGRKLNGPLWTSVTGFAPWTTRPS
ncbi:PRC-barrel domain containing protein [Massilia forsythiae]|uniref:PRC-barrel domain containing protein n=1 Tax=Massilia forsythiae TaxID=2728020 RepID=A0A7Z2ZUA8_9BURK|nr:PRC-barrel domain-containing protein [Massilia forsythiae]QJE02471.1 PRC-barrel domain containing protein [Massilia forsythiae]